MRPRMRLPLLIAAFVVVSMAAGCIGGPGKTMTAREGLADARSAAEAWADGADLQLVGIFALEPFKRIQHTDGEYELEYVTHLDGNPGDGRAPGWAYAFYTGERCISVLLASGLGVLAEGYETCDEQDVVPDWSVDSSEVAAILGRLDDWPDLGEDGTYFWELYADDGRAVWAVGGYSPDGESMGALVDASTGEVLELEVDARGYGFIGEVEATPVQPGASGVTMVHDEAHPLIVAGMPESIRVDLEGSGGYLLVHVDVAVAVSGVESCHATLIGPDGPLRQHGFGNGPGGAWDDQWDWLPAGTYTLELSPGLVGTCVQANLVLDGGWW